MRRKLCCERGPRRLRTAPNMSLGNEGPAKALLVATQAEKLGLPDLPKTERVLIAALRQLRERRVISGLSNQYSELPIPRMEVSSQA